MMMSKKKIRILIADDHELFREGLSELITREEDMECIAMARDGEEALKLVAELVPDVAIIDVAMPGMCGTDLAKHLKERWSDIAVIMLSAYNYKSYLLASLEAGVESYLLKDTPRRELTNSIRLVASGKCVYNLGINKSLLCSVGRRNGAEIKILKDLNRRELEILKLATCGLGNKQIAARLSLSTHTIETHFINNFRKRILIIYISCKNCDFISCFN